MSEMLLSITAAMACISVGLLAVWFFGELGAGRKVHGLRDTSPVRL